MMLGFNQRFVKPIATQTKIHTIREDQHNRWKPGTKIHMATGVRTKNCRKFREEVCVSTQEIEIIYHFGAINVFIDDVRLTQFEIYQLALNDGFFSLAEFKEWFNQDFKGKIIHWTDFRYAKEVVNEQTV
jgi:uncharacterized protein YqfB (UPF0267 family)